MNKLSELYYKPLNTGFSSVRVPEKQTNKQTKINPPCFVLLATLQDFIAKRRKIFNNYYFGHFGYLLTNELQIQFRVALYFIVILNTCLWHFWIHQF